MKAIAAKQPSNDATRKHRVKEQTPGTAGASVFSSPDIAIQRKPSCPCGGGCPRCRGVIQAKLMINEPGDIYEQEADRVADLASPGRPLEPVLRQDMEQRFGYDFSRVRVHSSAVAGQSAREVNANAYTVGHNIVFSAGRFAPGTNEGRRLIAHELTHVMQQSGADGIYASQVNEKRGLSPIQPKQVMRMPEPPLQRACPCGGGCTKCSNSSGGHAHYSALRSVSRAGASRLSKGHILRQEDSRYYQTDPNLPANQPAVGDFFLCGGPPHEDQILRALDKANLWVASAILKLDQFTMGGQTIEEETAVRLALRDNFNITETHPPETLLPKTPLKTILDNFVTIKGALNQTLHFYCASACGPGELAWVLPTPEKLGLPPGIIAICPLFFGCDPLKQASTIIHERAHQALGAEDHAYEVKSLYDSLPTIMALENAESYAVAARQIHHGGIHGPGLSCGGASRIRPLELLKLTPPPPMAPSPPESRKRDPSERHPRLLGGKLTPPTPPTGMSPESPTPVPTPTPSGAASGKTARVRKMETLRGCAYTVTYANQKEVDCDTVWKNEKGTKPPKPFCGTSLVYDIISVSASGSKCPAKLEGLKASENTKGDHGCTPPDFAWPTGSCIIGPGGKVSGCTDTFTLCGFTDALKGDCTEIVDQEIEVGGQLAEEHEIIFELKKSGKGCTGKVTRN